MPSKAGLTGALNSGNGHLRGAAQQGRILAAWPGVSAPQDLTSCGWMGVDPDLVVLPGRNDVMHELWLPVTCRLGIVGG